MAAGRDSDRQSECQPPEQKAIYLCNRIRRNETDDELEPAATIPPSRYRHRGYLRWSATQALQRLHAGLPDEYRMYLAGRSRGDVFLQRFFEFSWKPFGCAQRIVNRLQSPVGIGNRPRPDQPGIPLSISAFVGNFFTNINSR